MHRYVCNLTYCGYLNFIYIGSSLTGMCKLVNFMQIIYTEYHVKFIILRYALVKPEAKAR